MTRTITVKGVGSATAKPDYVIISMTLDAQDMKYEKAMELAAVHLEQLKASLAGTGFDKEALKTTNFQCPDRLSERAGRERNVEERVQRLYRFPLAEDRIRF